MTSVEMMAHPWMTKELDKDSCLDHTKDKLSKYITDRKENSKRELLKNVVDEIDI